ncbi:MAG: hypothetical protein JO180_07280, partial [Gemmatirosa sp.]|nr:hypothetical protein [Gemmatirosa sp.]
MRRAVRWIRRGSPSRHLLCAIALVPLASTACKRDKNELVEDTPHKLGIKPERYAEASADAFAPMDGGVALTQDEVKGRNTWMMWAGGNGEFWDWLARYGYGTTDLLRLLDSRKRPTRFATMGLVNDPNMRQATKPDAYGLYLDEVATPEPAAIDTFVYGKPSGIVGLRLFPNPDFDAKARAAWDANKFYADASYYTRTDLVRPYIVGMSCAFCHVAANPMHPPADPEKPQWADLSGNIGNQFFRTKNIFAYGSDESSFVYQVLGAMHDGTLDTSFLASDQIFNPSTMNAIYEVGGRLQAAELAPPEKIAEASMKLPQMQPTMHVPHILKDGADNVGVLAALTRVYVNIGAFHQQWLRTHQVLIGAKPQKAFSVANAAENSVYFQVTEHRSENLAKYFLHSAAAMHLENAPGGAAFITKDAAVMNRGKTVFAEECASCHSSKRPPAGTA